MDGQQDKDHDTNLVVHSIVNRVEYEIRLRTWTILFFAASCVNSPSENNLKYVMLRTVTKIPQ